MMEPNNNAVVYLVPVPLHDGAIDTLPPSLLPAVKQCNAFFVENERSARRFLKSIWKEMVIDHYHWITIHKAEEGVRQQFNQLLKEGKKIAIISEAGCPGIADPGQLLVAEAHRLGVTVKPLTGPSSILLALMAAGLDGQRFQFVGYLPIDAVERTKSIRQLEAESAKKEMTMIFIETPYRNNQLMETLLKTLQPSTKLSVSASLTSPDELIRTASIAEWKKLKVDLHKKPAIFCFNAK